MRGVATPITFLRREVFKNVADASYEGWDRDQIKQIPYTIIEGDTPKYRDSIERERNIVRARVRLALNMDLHAQCGDNFVDDMDLETLGSRKVSEDLLKVIPAACEACEEKSFFVTNSCHGCLAQPCVSVCPVKATSIKDGQSYIDQEACIKCGKCFDVCPYGSIVKNERPCVAACGVDAITKDEQDRAVIVSEKCVGCGQCMVSCPFGAIMDKSEIYQVVDSFRHNEQISAIIAPAFVGQFGDKVTPEQVIEGLFLLGFTEVKEVAYGADVTAVDEAKHYLKHVPVDQPFLATSCCPAWLLMAQKELKEKAYCISPSSSPMIETASAIRKKYPETKIVFIGPCSAKKLEATFADVSKSVDYVLTFEEVNAMFHSRGIILEDVVVVHEFGDASFDGRGFAISGGVAAAVENVVRRLDPDRVVKMEKAETLKNCKTMVLMAKAGKRDGFLLEGMACPGGCVGGAGTIVNQQKSSRHVQNYSRNSEKSTALKTVETFNIDATKF